jgi:hypothetical protein
MGDINQDYRQAAVGDSLHKVLKDMIISGSLTKGQADKLLALYDSAFVSILTDVLDDPIVKEEVAEATGDVDMFRCHPKDGSLRWRLQGKFEVKVGEENTTANALNVLFDLK